MNERYLFRGVARVNKQFVIGWLDLEEDSNEMSIRPVDGIMRYVINQNTVGQCTGLKDKNGKLIFEGDILRIENLFDGIIVFKDGCFLSKYIEDEDIYEYLWYLSEQLEIIGNIHEEEHYE